jgi:hypothetical protein
MLGLCHLFNHRILRRLRDDQRFGTMDQASKFYELALALTIRVDLILCDETASNVWPLRARWALLRASRWVA